MWVETPEMDVSGPYAPPLLQTPAELEKLGPTAVVADPVVKSMPDVKPRLELLAVKVPAAPDGQTILIFEIATPVPTKFCTKALALLF